MKKSTKLVAESCGSYPNGREFVHVYIEYPDGTIESLGLSRAFSFERGIKVVSKSAPATLKERAARPRSGASLNPRSRKAA